MIVLLNSISGVLEHALDFAHRCRNAIFDVSHYFPLFFLVHDVEDAHFESFEELIRVYDGSYCFEMRIQFGVPFATFRYYTPRKVA
jgi:hypothetical protein